MRPGVADKGGNLGLVRTRLNKIAHVIVTPFYWRAAVHGVAPTSDLGAVPFAHDFRTVIDVGANRGQFALFAAHRFPRALIYSIEPLPEAAAAVSRLLGKRVRVFERAAGAHEGRATLHVTRKADGSTLLPVKFFDPLDVRVSTLDSVIASVERPALLKMDVQGYELEALRGATRLLTEVDEALIECTFHRGMTGWAFIDDVCEFLSSHGLQKRGLYSLTFLSDGSYDQADVLFTRSQPSG